MCAVSARSSTRPDTVRLSSNDNGRGVVIKHRTAVPQASISHVPQRFTEVGVWREEGTCLTSHKGPRSISLPAHENSICFHLLCQILQ